MKERLGGIQIIRPSEGEVKQWLLPEIDLPETERQATAEQSSDLEAKAETEPKPDDPKPPTAAELEQIQQQARDEGFEQGRSEGHELGHREGVEQGRRELLEKLQQFDGLMSTLDRPFEKLDDQVEREVVTLVISMVRQLVRREMKTDPGHVIGVVREALSVLPVAARNIRVLLHPEDAVLVRDIYAVGESEQKWQIVEDPVIQRGGCKVVTETSQVDATLESRLSALIAPLLACERNDDDDDEDPAS